MTISILPDRLEEIRRDTRIIQQQTEITKKQLQRIIGKISFVCNCVRVGLVFTCHLLHLLRAMGQNNKVLLDADTKKDFNWWNKFLPSYY